MGVGREKIHCLGNTEVGVIQEKACLYDWGQDLEEADLMSWPWAGGFICLFQDLTNLLFATSVYLIWFKCDLGRAWTLSCSAVDSL